MKKLFTITALLALAALAIFSCDKKEQPLQPDQAKQMSVEYYTADNVHRGIKWIDTSSGAIMSTKFVVEEQADFRYALLNSQFGDTISVATESPLYFIANLQPLNICQVVAFLTKTQQVDLVTLRFDSIATHNAHFLGGAAGPIFVEGLDTAYCTMGMSGPTISDVEFEGVQDWPYGVYVPWSNSGDLIDCTVGSYEHPTRHEIISRLAAYYPNTGSVVNLTIDGELDEDCEPVSYAYASPEFDVESWTIIGTTTRSYDLTESPIFDEYALDGYDRSCDATVSLDVDFPTGLDNDNIASVFIDYGCSSVTEQTAAATLVSGKWRAKLDTSPCTGEECEFFWRPRVVYCSGTMHATAYTGATSQENMVCGICGGRK